MGADEYERQYLGGDEALHREKRVSRKVFGMMLAISGLIWVLALTALAAFVFGGDWQGLGGAGLMGTLALFLTVLSFALPVARTVVTRSHLRFMIGLRNVAVPLGSITETSVGAVDPGTIRADVARDKAQLSSIFFPEGRYVRVAWADARGKPNVVWIGSDDAPALRAALDQARGAAQVRVAGDASEPLAAEPEGGDLAAPRARDAAK